MHGRQLIVGSLAMLCLTGLVACGNDDAGGGGGAAEVLVTGTDAACTPEPAEVAAGKTTFVFTNRAGQVNELYIRAGDNVIKEVENVVSGSTKKLTVTLEAGKAYTVNCKPGQKGDGIAAPITVK